MPDLLTREDYRALASFRHALRAFLQFSAQAARRVGLTPQQHQALLALQGAPGGARVDIGQLAARLQVRHHSAVGLADRLERRGLVRRVPMADDRRRVELRLTAKGAALIARLSHAHREELRRWGPELHRALRRILQG